MHKQNQINNRSNNLTRGFGTVGISITIALVGLVAVIFIVIFSNYRNQDFDSLVKSDLAKISEKFEEYKKSNDEGLYPMSSLTGTPTPELRVSVNKNAYRQGNKSNLLNCTPYVGTGTTYALLAQSKSGKFFAVSYDNSEVREISIPFASIDVAACPSVLAGSRAYGAGYDSGSWREWTNS